MHVRRTYNLQQRLEELAESPHVSSKIVHLYARLRQISGFLSSILASQNFKPDKYFFTDKLDAIERSILLLYTPQLVNQSPRGISYSILQCGFRLYLLGVEAESTGRADMCCCCREDPFRLGVDRLRYCVGFGTRSVFVDDTAWKISCVRWRDRGTVA